MDVWGHSSLFPCAWRPCGEEWVRALFFRYGVIKSSSVVGIRLALSSAVSSYLVSLVLVSEIVEEGVLRASEFRKLLPRPPVRWSTPLGVLVGFISCQCLAFSAEVKARYLVGFISCQCLAFSAEVKARYSLLSYRQALIWVQASISSCVGLRASWSRSLPPLRPPPPRPLPGPPLPMDERPLRVVPGLSWADVVRLKIV